MDIWEANSVSAAVTAHNCQTTGQFKCNDTKSCGGLSGPDRYVGHCDRDGCDFNSFRLGNNSFYGRGMMVDTNQLVTVTTQFATDGTGNLNEIRRIYSQNGKKIFNSKATFPSLSQFNSITQPFCDAEKALFKDKNDFKKLGGLNKLSQSMKNGMVLVLSLWDDYEQHMLWLDSQYPTTSDPSVPGVLRGPCATNTGQPKVLQNEYPTAHVIYSNIRFGPIGSTM